MYNSFGSIVFTVMHYAMAILIVFVFVPKLIFSAGDGDQTEALLARYVKMVLLIIGMVYVLVLTKLYEVISITMVLGIIATRSLLPKKASDKREQAVAVSAQLLYGFLDREYNPVSILRAWLDRHTQESSSGMSRLLAQLHRFASFALLAVVVLGSAYVRFYDTFKYPAPPMSDSYVTLAWMKYLNNRILFHDGIYPQGFHAYMSVLSKFAAVDPLYILRYTGSLNGLMVMFGMYMAVRRWTANKMAATASLVVFGLLGYVLSIDEWQRQAATNSQEFAMVFVWPTMYFYLKYLRTRDRLDLFSGFAALTVVGLVHTWIYLMAAMGYMTVLGVASVVPGLRSLRTLMELLASGALSLLLSVIPLGIGYMLGRSLHSTTASFLTATTPTISFPPLHGLDYAALCSIVILMIRVVWDRNDIEDVLPQLVVSILVTLVFIIYFLGNALTHSELMSARSNALWVLAVPVVIGMAWAEVFRPLMPLTTAQSVVGRGLTFAVFTQKSRYRFWTPGRVRALQLGLCSAFVLYAMVASHLTPIVPYRMEWGEDINIYLRVNSTYAPDTWMIVSQNEGYAVVYGRGYHMYVKDFVKDFDPTKPFLTKVGQSHPDFEVPTDVFVVRENKVFEVAKSNSIYSIQKPLYVQRKKDSTALAKWMAIHMKDQHDTSIYFKDAHITVYHLSMGAKAGGALKNFWQQSS